MIFTLSAQVLGRERTATADRDGYGQITVQTSTGPVTARTAREAIRVAHRDIGVFLRPAEKPGVPWGLRVMVSTVQAVYGEWPLIMGGGDGTGSRPQPITRIRDRWQDGAGPLAALENAIQIIQAYSETPGRKAA